MPLGLPPIPIEQIGDLDANIRAICNMAPQATPGQVVSYSASIGFTLLGELIRRFDPRGRPYRQILTEDLLHPLGMADSAVGSRRFGAPACAHCRQ
jgi:CubicO group peptidase (beta-lactamase class C family)